MTDANLDFVRRLPEYRQSRERLFPSEGSMQWFVRNHRAELIERGALLLHAGKWHAHETRFDAFVIEAGQLAARGQLQDGGAPVGQSSADV